MMLRRILVLAAVVVSVALSGCRRQPTPVAEDETVKTEEQIRSEAREEITTENLDEQINQMEDSINQDVQTE